MIDGLKICRQKQKIKKNKKNKKKNRTSIKIRFEKFLITTRYISIIYFFLEI